MNLWTYEHFYVILRYIQIDLWWLSPCLFPVIVSWDALLSSCRGRDVCLIVCDLPCLILCDSSYLIVLNVSRCTHRILSIMLLDVSAAIFCPQCAPVFFWGVSIQKGREYSKWNAQKIILFLNTNLKLQMKRTKKHFILSKYFFWAELAEVGAELAWVKKHFIFQKCFWGVSKKSIKISKIKLRIFLQKMLKICSNFLNW